MPGAAAPCPEMRHCGRGTLRESCMGNFWGLVELQGLWGDVVPVWSMRVPLSSELDHSCLACDQSAGAATSVYCKKLVLSLAALPVLDCC